MNAKLRTAKLGIAVLLVMCTFTGMAVADTGDAVESDLENNETPYEYNAENFTIWIKGKSLCAENIVEQRKALIDTFRIHSGDKIPSRYVSVTEDFKISNDTRLVAYGFKILPDGEIKEYRGYCSKDLEGYGDAISKANKWFSTIDAEPATLNQETSNVCTVLLGNDWHDWSRINACTDDYTYSPYGDYNTITEWFWDAGGTNSEKDYFMLRSKFSMMPGHQQYNNYWLNYYGYITHNWNYCDYPGAREMYDAVPYDGAGKTTISVTLSRKTVFSMWSTIIPDYSMNDKSDYIQDKGKWEININPLSENCGGSNFTVWTGSFMHCSQDEARSGERLGLACFEAKPMWVQLDPFNAYTPGFHGYSNCVRWTGSEYND